MLGFYHIISTLLFLQLDEDVRVLLQRFDAETADENESKSEYLARGYNINVLRDLARTLLPVFWTVSFLKISFWTGKYFYDNFLGGKNKYFPY